jgi:hypothetical protein
MSAKPFVYRNDGLDILEEPIRAYRNDEGQIEGKNHTYVLVADTSRGVGGDYCAFTITDITEFPYKVVAKYRNNKISPLMYPNIIHKVAKDYNNAYCLVEINDNGQQVADSLYSELEYENVFFVGHNSKSGQFLSGGFQPGATLGVRTTKQVKSLGCTNFKSMVESSKLLIHDPDIIHEISTFIEQRNSFAADVGYHDDLVMTMVLLGWASNNLFFKDLTNINLRTVLYEEQFKYIEESLTPFGFIDIGEPKEIAPEVSGDELWFSTDVQEGMEKLKQKWMESV